MAVSKADLTAKVATCQFYLFCPAKMAVSKADLTAKVATCQFYLVLLSKSGLVSCRNPAEPSGTQRKPATNRIGPGDRTIDLP